MIFNACKISMITISLFYCSEKVFIPMNVWMIEKYSIKTSLSEKGDFYTHLNMKDITDADDADTKRVFKDFEIKYF